MANNTQSARARGFSLVEIMVAMVIALVGIIVIFQVFALSEGTKRTTTSGGDAQQSGALALFSIERDLRQAGFGLNVSADLGCIVVAFDGARAANQQYFAFTLAPVQILAAATATDSDVVMVSYASGTRVPHPTRIAATQPANDADPVKVDNRYGFYPGDVIILADQTLSAPGGALTPPLTRPILTLAAQPSQARCMMAQVTSLGTDADDNQITMGRMNTSFIYPNGTSGSAEFNPPGALFVGGNRFSTNGQVYNIGPKPILNQYFLCSPSDATCTPKNQLRVVAYGLTTGAPAIADNIVMLKAQYGKDTDLNGTVDTWNATTPTTAIGWQQVLAVRVAVVARSTLPEKPSAGTTCDATPDASAPVIFKDTLNPAGVTLDLSASAPAGDDWKCYRYKAFETTIPLRNQLWQQCDASKANLPSPNNC